MHARLGTLLLSGAVAAGLTFLPGLAAAGGATITLTPEPVAPDGVLTVAGTGCAPASPVNLRVWNTGDGTSSIDNSFTADGAGEFSHDVPLENLFPAGSEIGATFFCGDLFDETVPHAVDYTVVAIEETGVSVAFDRASPRYGQTVVATVTSTPSTALGAVMIYVDGLEVGAAAPYQGTTEFTLPADLAVGTRAISVAFDPHAEGAETATDDTTLVVRKARATTRLRLSDDRIRNGQSTTAVVRVVCRTATATGRLVIRDGDTVLRRVRLVAGDGGRRSITLDNIRGVGEHVITADYQGSRNVAGDRSRNRVLTVTR